jgi:hypothetical protein
MKFCYSLARGLKNVKRGETSPRRNVMLFWNILNDLYQWFMGVWAKRIFVKYIEFQQC